MKDYAVPEENILGLSLFASPKGRKTDRQTDRQTKRQTENIRVACLSLLKFSVFLCRFGDYKVEISTCNDTDDRDRRCLSNRVWSDVFRNRIAQ